MSGAVANILGLIFAIVATVLAVIFVMPQSKAPKLNKFLYTIHNIINFKTLLIEKILKILYVFSTCYAILAGFFMLFSWDNSYSSLFGLSGTKYNGGTGLLFMILGPIVIRLVYESLMMFIIMVNNTIELRKHFCDGDKDSEAPAQGAEKVEPHYVFCSKCGTRYNENAGGCPNGCGKDDDAPKA